MSLVGVTGASADAAPVQSAEPTDQSLQPNLEQVPAESQPVVESTGHKSIDDKISRQFAALSRKEKAVKAEREAFKQKEAELSQRLAELEKKLSSRDQEFESYRTGIKTSPLQKLEEEGIDFETLTQMQLNDRNPTPEMLIKRSEKKLETELNAKIEALTKQLAEEKAKIEQQAEERTVAAYRKQISEFVGKDSDKYELINLNYAPDDAANEIFDIIEMQYNKSGQQVMLSIDEAADYLEAYLTEQASKNLKAKKFAAAPQPKLNSEKMESKTLSNELSAEIPKGNSRVLSREEEIEEAAKLIRWE